METDASDFAIGSTLKLCNNDGSRSGTAGTMYLVNFFSKKPQDSEQNWSPRKNEAYAKVSSLCKWDSWIRIQPATVHSDHHPLQHW